MEVLAICSSGLLGLETITAIWSRREDKKQSYEETTYKPQRRVNRKELEDESERECD